MHIMQNGAALVVLQRTEQVHQHNNQPMEIWRDQLEGDVVRNHAVYWRFSTANSGNPRVSESISH